MRGLLSTVAILDWALSAKLSQPKVVQYTKYELAEFGDRSSSVSSQCNNTVRPARLMQIQAVSELLYEELLIPKSPNLIDSE